MIFVQIRTKIQNSLETNKLRRRLTAETFTMLLLLVVVDVDVVVVVVVVVVGDVDALVVVVVVVVGSEFCTQRLPLGPSNMSAFMRSVQACPSSERKRASSAANCWVMTASSGSVLK